MTTSIKQNALVPYSAAQIYDLVNDVEKYPEFLPWCKDSKVVERGDDYLKVQVDIAKGSIHKSFVTRNVLTPKEKIEIFLEDGPFHILEGIWCFIPLDEKASKIDFELDFKFSNKFLEMAVGPFFKHIANTFVHSFEQRAKTVYKNDPD